MRERSRLLGMRLHRCTRSALLLGICAAGCSSAPSHQAPAPRLLRIGQPVLALQALRLDPTPLAADSALSAVLTIVAGRWGMHMAGPLDGPLDRCSVFAVTGATAADLRAITADDEFATRLASLLTPEGVCPGDRRFPGGGHWRVDSLQRVISQPPLLLAHATFTGATQGHQEMYLLRPGFGPPSTGPARWQLLEQYRYSYAHWQPVLSGERP